MNERDTRKIDKIQYVEKRKYLVWGRAGIVLMGNDYNQ